MKLSSFFSLATVASATLCVFTSTIRAQVPQIINYQGRVAVGGTNFTGSGQFKFALVDGGTNTASTATATPTVSYGYLVAVTVPNGCGGSGYTSAPKVTITDPTGTGAVATASVSGGVVTAVTVSTPGSGYSANPTVTIAAPPQNIVCTSFWSNDGSSVAGAPPTAAVTLPVAQGLYSVLLGNTSLPNMTAIPYGVFGNSDVRLRVWFNDGTAHGWQQLTPDQRIAAVGYAMTANSAQTVPDGAITSAKIAAGAVTSAAIANGAITSAQLAPGAISGSNIASNSITGSQLSPTAAADSVGQGAFIMSDNPSATNLTNAGYVNVGKQKVKSEGWNSSSDPSLFSGIADDKLSSFLFLNGTNVMAVGVRYDYSGAQPLVVAKYNSSSRNWSFVPTTGTGPSFREGFSAVWTGTDVIIFGGRDANQKALGDGARFNSANNAWTPISSVGAPSARFLQTALWTGSKMIVWGGYGVGGDIQNGALYNPTTDTWSPISTTGTVYMPSATENATVWTGTEAFFWGYNFGSSKSYALTRYNPSSNTWSYGAIPSVSGSNSSFSLSNTAIPNAVWTGTEMIIWNVTVSQTPTPASPSHAARYNPTTDTWSLVTGTGSPTALYNSPSAVAWTGSQMTVVTGSDSGGSYNPATDSWSQISPYGLSFPSYVSQPVQALWSGSDTVIWNNCSAPSSNGGRFNPNTNSWTPILGTTRPGIRSQARAYWTGNALLVWGGYSSSLASWLTDGRLSGASLYDYWSAIGTTGAPTASSAYSTVWTGTELIVWGGCNGSTVFKTGARYNPATDTWTAVSTNGAPVARSNHSAIWTGTEMIVWGGKGSTGALLSDGARYNPSTDTWTSLSTGGAPAVRMNHSAVWTGTEMIVWGGNGNGGSFVNDGARYNLATNTWTALPATGAPAGRINPAAAWTGNEMLIWGGEISSSTTTNTGARYNPTTNTWKTMNASGAPSARTLHTGSWITNKFVVWGGSGTPGGGAPIYGDGAYYSPVYDQWTQIKADSAPSARYGHSVSVDAFNSKLYIFGGNDGSNDLNDIFYYSPELDMFLYQHQ